MYSFSIPEIFRNTKGFPYECFRYFETEIFDFFVRTTSMVYSNFRAQQLGSADFDLFSACFALIRFQTFVSEFREVSSSFWTDCWRAGFPAVFNTTSFVLSVILAAMPACRKCDHSFLGHLLHIHPSKLNFHIGWLDLVIWFVSIG